MDNEILTKSEDFAVTIIRLYQRLTNKSREYILSKQVLRSGTSIGANVPEAQNAQSRADFVSKMSIALKEATETKYWLKLLFRTEYITKSDYNNLDAECTRLIKILTSIVKHSK